LYYPAFVSNLIVAGDGYAYLAYQYAEISDCTPQVSWITHLMLLRVSSSGAYDKIKIVDLPATIGYWIPEGSFMSATLITNADKGVLLSWQIGWGAGDNPVPTDNFGMAVVTGTSVSLVNPLQVPCGNSYVVPVLQAQDGSFVGTACSSTMVAFDISGNIRWTVPNETPQIATADGGVIGQSGITYDQNGNATGQGPLYTQSWTYNLYQDGPVTQVAAMPALLATSWAFQLQKTAAKPLPDSVKANTDVVSGLGTVRPQREIDYYPFQGNNYWGDISFDTARITEYLIKVSGDWPPLHNSCNAPGYNANASNGTFCGTQEKEFDDLISSGFVRRQQMWVQLPNVRNYRVHIYPCTAQNKFGQPVWENQLSALTREAIVVNGDAGSTTKRTCHQ
jgi:hypothetical protein